MPAMAGTSMRPWTFRWNGWTITDVVFPSFLWIVGVAMTLAMAKRLQAGATRSRIYGQVLKRALILYALGLLIYAYPEFHLSTQRFLGVLQRIAICYLIASIIYLYSGIRAQIVWIVALLAGYWLIMKLIPVPGFGAGQLDVEGNWRITSTGLCWAGTTIIPPNLGPRRHRQHPARDRDQCSLASWPATSSA